MRTLLPLPYERPNDVPSTFDDDVLMPPVLVARLLEEYTDDVGGG